MHLEEELSLDDLRVMANAIKITDTGYEAFYLPVGLVSAWPAELDGQIKISRLLCGYYSQVVLPKESEADAACHRTIMESLMEHTQVFEGKLYDRRCKISRDMKGRIVICSPTDFPEDEAVPSPAAV